MAEVIEHLISLAVNDPCLDHCILQLRGTDNFLGLPLRLVIRRSTACSRPQETEQQDLFHPCLSRRVHHVPGSLHVDSVIGLVPDLTANPGAVSDSVAS